MLPIFVLILLRVAIIQIILSPILGEKTKYDLII